MRLTFTRREALKGLLSAGALSCVSATTASAEEAPILIASKPVEVTVCAISRNTVRVTVQAIERGSPLPLPEDGALTKTQWDGPVLKFRSLSGPRTLRSGKLNITALADPLRIRIENQVNGSEHVLVQEIGLGPDSWELRFNTGDGHLLGLGQGGPQFDRRGIHDVTVNGQEGYRLATHGARVPIQFLIGTDGWGMYVHQPIGAFDLAGQEGRLVPESEQASQTLDVFVIAAREPDVILREYANLTGFAEMPPLWSLGYQQSHRTLGTPEEILEEAKIFREKKLPCDTMIYLGSGFCPNGWNTDNGEFTWNKRAFPDPVAAIQQLQGDHFKVVLHVALEGERLTGTVNDSCTAAPLPSGRTPDHHWPPDRQVSCYWPAHKSLMDLGVDGWWPDQGDGLDAPSRLARNRMYFDGQQMYRPNTRVFALHRNAYAGMQRYAAFLWSGDVESRWETLQTHIPIAINTSLSGIPYWGTDIGGFIPTAEYTGELYARWFQFAAFCPLFRSHGRDWKLHRPWGWDTGDIGYPETPGYHPSEAELHNPTIEPICRKYLELRYRLMSYVYSAVKETCNSGLPIIRALWLHYPDDPLAVARGDEYLYGRDLLIAPVVVKAASERAVYLPRGNWYDFWTNAKHQGGREITRDVDLATLPVYVREGAIIPMDPVRQYTGQQVDGPLSLIVYPGANGAFRLYQDDGESFDFHHGVYTQIDMQWNNGTRQLLLSLAQGSRPPGHGRLPIEVRVAGETAAKNVSFDGRPLKVSL